MMLAVALGAATCRPPVPPAAMAPPPARARAWSFDVAASAGARELAVEARIPAPRGATVGVESAGRFLSGVEVSTGGPFAPLAAGRDTDGDPSYRLPPCPPEGCRVRYRFALEEAAHRVSEIGCAERVGEDGAANGVFLTSPSAWLLHPAEADEGDTFELHVTTAPGTSFIAGLASPGSAALPPQTYAAGVADLPNPAWGAFGPLRLTRLDVPDAAGAADEAIDLAIVPATFAVGDAGVATWVRDAARAVHAYYGRASIARALVVVVPRARTGIGFARTLGNGGATIVANLGTQTGADELAASWELVHELLHVSFPTLPREHAWLEEGMATYVEPLVRARVGLVRAETVFARLRERMPLGLPDAGDLGLDRTHTWGRTYWGGALFCLLADVAIRERTGNRRSLDDALRAVLAAGGNVSQRWDMEQVIAVGDAATGVPVLRELYASMATAPVAPDLDALWKRLGVRASAASGAHAETVVFDEGAELAAVRRAMTGTTGTTGR
jgi:hypothetical protein